MNHHLRIYDNPALQTMDADVTGIVSSNFEIKENPSLDSGLNKRLCEDVLRPYGWTTVGNGF